MPISKIKFALLLVMKSLISQICKTGMFKKELWGVFLCTIYWFRG